MLGFVSVALIQATSLWRQLKRNAGLGPVPVSLVVSFGNQFPGVGWRARMGNATGKEHQGWGDRAGHPAPGTAAYTRRCGKGSFHLSGKPIHEGK